MGRRNSGGWLIFGLIGLGLFKCGDTKTPTPPPSTYSAPPAVTQNAPIQSAYSSPAAQPPVSPRSLFSEPTTNGFKGELAAEIRPIQRSLYVRGKDVPMRASSNAKAKILNRLPNGMQVGILSRRDDWIEIRHPISAIEGWVSARRLSEAAPQAAETNVPEDRKPKRKEPSGIEVLSDAAIIAKLIALDAAAYSGNCRCPENTDRAGRRCGSRSAYSRLGGWVPLCYAGDVTREAIAEFRMSGRR